MYSCLDLRSDGGSGEAGEEDALVAGGGAGEELDAGAGKGKGVGEEFDRGRRWRRRRRAGRRGGFSGRRRCSPWMAFLWARGTMRRFSTAPAGWVFQPVSQRRSRGGSGPIQEIFPHCGKKFSTVWKKTADFSTQWKNVSRFFHTMEKMFPWRGKTQPPISTREGS